MRIYESVINSASAVPSLPNAYEDRSSVVIEMQTGDSFSHSLKMQSADTAHEAGKDRGSEKSHWKRSEIIVVQATSDDTRARIEA